MKVPNKDAIVQNWENVESLNYKLKGIGPYESVVYAKLTGIHGKVSTKDVERVYYILSGKGQFLIDGNIIDVEAKDVLTLPPHTEYDYWATPKGEMEILLFMELWDN